MVPACPVQTSISATAPKAAPHHCPQPDHASNRDLHTKLATPPPPCARHGAQTRCSANVAHRTTLIAGPPHHPNQRIAHNCRYRTNHLGRPVRAPLPIPAPKQDRVPTPRPHTTHGARTCHRSTTPLISSAHTQPEPKHAHSHITLSPLYQPRARDAPVVASVTVQHARIRLVKDLTAHAVQLLPLHPLQGSYHRQVHLRHPTITSLAPCRPPAQRMTTTPSLCYNRRG